MAERENCRENVSSKSKPRTPPKEIQRLEASKDAFFEACAKWTEDTTNLMAEYQKLKDDRYAIQEYIDNVEAENRLYKQQLKELPQNNQNLEQMLNSSKCDSRQTSVPSHSTQVQSLKRRIERIEKNRDEYIMAYENLLKDQESLESKYREMKAELRPILEDNNKLKKEIQINVHVHEKQTQVLQVQHDREIRSIKTELQDTKCRLSQLMSAQVTNNNPDIADLNDAYRPNKLGEMYRELYDNQWSEAFEAHHGDEREKVQMLKEVLMDARQFCEDTAKAQRKQLTCCLFGKEYPSSVSNTLVKDIKDLTKAVLPYNIDIIGQRYLDKRRGDSQYQEMEQYYRECAKVCWIMVLSDPPVVFGSELKNGYEIDKGTYSLYTNTGDLCDYEVWPALFMSMGGALVSRGIVQAIEAAESTSKELTGPRSKEAWERNVGLDRNGKNQMTCTAARREADFSQSLHETSTNSHITPSADWDRASNKDYTQTTIRVSSKQVHVHQGRHQELDTTQRRRANSAFTSHNNKNY